MNTNTEKKAGNKIVLRGVFTVIVMALYGLINNALNVAAPIITGEMAVKQLNNSNADYFSSQFGMRFFDGSGISILVLLLVLVGIWWKPLMQLKANLFPAIIIVGLLSIAPNAFAYYDTVNRQEVVEIPANCTGFLIPLSGNNLDSQGD